MALRLPASKAAEFAIGSIGCGYDLAIDVRLKYCKESRLLDIQDGDDTREIVLPGGITIPNVSKSIKCDKGERMRFSSDVLSFQQMTEQFNQELSLAGKIPSGLFNAMFEFSGCWQKDAAYTKNLAFDGIFISFYSVALDKSQMLLREHVKQAVPSTWDPAALARFIDTYGTHIVVGVKMGGKDVIYAKQQHSSKLQPDDLQKRLKEVADKRFIEASGVQNIASDRIHPTSKVEAKEQRLRFADTSSLGSYANKEDIVFMCKRRGGNDNRNLTHNDWLQTVQTEPDAISMSLIPITSLLNGCPGSGFLSHAINLYLRYKPPISELHQFLEFQLPRQWAPVFSELPLGPQRKQQSCASLQFSFFGPKLFVNTTPVDVGKRPEDMLGTMLTKEILPLYDKELDYLLCDLKYDAEEFLVHGKMGIVKDEEDDGVEVMEFARQGRPVVEVGTVIFAEVLGRTLSGRPLLSSRRYFRRIAWHRVRQIKQINEPIEVKITEWNTGGLLTRIEGLRGFIPKQELVKRVNSFTELKENVGRRLVVQITRLNEDKNDLILSEKTAWEKRYLREGTLLEGTVARILPYGAQVRLGESSRSGLLHISNITRRRIGSVSDVLQVDESLKVLVVKSLFPDKISLSIADLESEPGLFITNREKVFMEAEEMAQKYRAKMPTVTTRSEISTDHPPITSSFPQGKDEEIYANWDWFKFESQ